MGAGNLLQTGVLLIGLCAGGFAQDAADRYYTAIRNNDMAALAALVKAGGIDAKDKRGSTPLHISAAYGSLESMRVLLAVGAGVSARNDFDATPRMWWAVDAE